MKPLTAEDFKHWANVNGIDLIESEWGGEYYAYGHINKDDFARAVEDYNVDVAGLSPEEAYIAPHHVEHKWAVTVENDDEGWLFHYATEDATDAFPVTVVTC